MNNRIKLGGVKKSKGSTVGGFRVEKREEELTDRVSLRIFGPGGRLRFKLSMTKKEWKKLIK